MTSFIDKFLGDGNFREYWWITPIVTFTMIVSRYVVSQIVKWYVRKTNPIAKPYHPAKAAGLFLRIVRDKNCE